MNNLTAEEKELFGQYMSKEITSEQQILNRISDGIEAPVPKEYNIPDRLSRDYFSIPEEAQTNYNNLLTEKNKLSKDSIKQLDNIDQVKKNHIGLNYKELDQQKEFFDISKAKPNLTEEQQLAKNIKEELEFLETDRIVSPREGQKIMQEVKTGEGKSVIDRQFKGTQGGSFEDRLNYLSSGNRYNSRKAKQAEQDVAEKIAKNKSKLKELGEESGEGLMKGFLKSPTGKLMAGIGVTAFLVSNMNNSKGQQSNAELYGQQSPYQY